MPNTLTGLIPTLYESLDVVSRELVGMVPSVNRDSNVSRAAVNQTVLAFVTPASTASDLTPGVTAPNDGDQNIGQVSVTITKARGVPVRWNGEEVRGLGAGGPGRANIMKDQFTQALRTLTNEMESDLAGLHIHASRAFGVATADPFATNLADTAQIRKILDDNGAAPSERSIVINTSAGAAARTLSQLTKANEAGTDTILRQGELINIHGFSMKESAQIKSFTKGTGASYTTNASGFAVGALSIGLITGSGTVLVGDSVTFAGDTNKYMVVTGITAPGTIVIASPGLRVAIAAAATAVTVVGSSSRSMAFPRTAIVLATRMPALPEEGDMADDRTTITDPRSGLSFEVALYRQYRQVRYEISAAWGVKVTKVEHLAVLLGLPA